MMPNRNDVYVKAPKAGAPKEKTPPRIEVKLSWCKGCGLCVAYCNRGVLEMKGILPAVLHAEKCSRCLQCEAICPDFAIQVIEQTPADDRPAADVAVEAAAVESAP
jgi:2-oxoglutarate ferredoxin oxidoreductase subunit delta